MCGVICLFSCFTKFLNILVLSHAVWIDTLWRTCFPSTFHVARKSNVLSTTGTLYKGSETGTTHLLMTGERDWHWSAFYIGSPSPSPEPPSLLSGDVSMWNPDNLVGKLDCFPQTTVFTLTGLTVTGQRSKPDRMWNQTYGNLRLPTTDSLRWITDTHRWQTTASRPPWTTDTPLWWTTDSCPQTPGSFPCLTTDSHRYNYRYIPFLLNTNPGLGMIPYTKLYMFVFSKWRL